MLYEVITGDEADPAQAPRSAVHRALPPGSANRPTAKKRPSPGTPPACPGRPAVPAPFGSGPQPDASRLAAVPASERLVAACPARFVSYNFV